MAHLQSYLFAMDQETLRFLIEANIFSKEHYAKTFQDAIYQKEVLMSRKIIQHGWNIGSLLQHYNGVDFRHPIPVLLLDDIMFPNYRDKLWTDQGLVFVKGNRLGY
jgi:hypothetical protein